MWSSDMTADAELTLHKLLKDDVLVLLRVGLANDDQQVASGEGTRRSHR